MFDYKDYVQDVPVGTEKVKDRKKRKQHDREALDRFKDSVMYKIERVIPDSAE